MSTDELLDEERQRNEVEPEPPSPQRLYEHLIREPIGNSDPRPAICVNPRTTVADAIALMKLHGMGCVLVEADRRLVGIFTERDVLFRVAAANRDAKRTPVSEVMTPDPETLTMHDELAWVLNLMAVGGFRHVPIVDDDGRPCAVFSVKHIVERLVEFFPNDVLNLPPHPGKNIAHTREGA
jgi:CBS domain-containing protein